MGDMLVMALQAAGDAPAHCFSDGQRPDNVPLPTPSPPDP